MRSSLGLSILGVVVVLVIVFFAVPVIAGGNTNICQDVESHDVSNTASNITGSKSGVMYNVINSVGQIGATGNAEQAKASTQNPNTPTVVSCATDYWKSL
jgi:hypothetical protein